MAVAYHRRIARARTPCSCAKTVRDCEGWPRSFGWDEDQWKIRVFCAGEWDLILHGQAPQANSLLLGSGRLARHLRFYFENLGLKFRTWSRRDSQPLDLSGIERLWLAISDDAIPAFIDHQ